VRSATAFWATPSTTTTTSRRLLRHLFREFAVAYESTDGAPPRQLRHYYLLGFTCPTSHVINSVITPEVSKAPGGFGNHYLAQNNKQIIRFRRSNPASRLLRESRWKKRRLSVISFSTITCCVLPLPLCWGYTYRIVGGVYLCIIV
jgi:hypothetical protein